MNRAILVSLAVVLLLVAKSARADEPAKQQSAPYLRFVAETVETLYKHQSARLGDRVDGTLFLTVSEERFRTVRSLGTKTGNTYQTYLSPEKPYEQEPYRADLALWAILERLSDATGDARYRQSVGEMARAFAEHGFHPQSGLGYLGENTQFDAKRMAPTRYADQLLFKPSPGQPLERLWQESPEKTERMIKAAFYSMITRDDILAYNRKGPYEFDDRARRLARPFSPHDVAFFRAGAVLIHWWAFCYARTGDADCLDWARRMTAKWQAVQHPETGLLPHCFKALDSNDREQGPNPFANIDDSGGGIVLLAAAEELARRPEGEALAEQVRGLGLRLLQGLAQYGYDEKKRSLPYWIHLDGRPYLEPAWYYFPTEEARAEAARHDPLLREVSVFAYLDLFGGTPFSKTCDARMPRDAAHAALLTKDPALLKRAQFLAEEVLRASREQKSARNADGVWTFHAAGNYIQMMLHLHEATKDGRYLAWARELADQQMKFLAGPFPEGTPEWWRDPNRNSLLDALLALHEVLAQQR